MSVFFRRARIAAAFEHEIGGQAEFDELCLDEGAKLAEVVGLREVDGELGRGTVGQLHVAVFSEEVGDDLRDDLPRVAVEVVGVDNRVR